MRRYSVLLLVAVLVCLVSACVAWADVAVDAEHFPDNVFREYLLSADVSIDKDQNGSLSEKEIANVTRIDVSGTYEENGKISSLKGIEYFTALTELHCSDNQLTELDVSELLRL